MNLYQVMKVSLKPVNFIGEYLKAECIGIVLEAGDGPTMHDNDGIKNATNLHI